MSYKIYIILFIILIIIIFGWCHIRFLYKKNDELEILQSETLDDNIIQDLLNRKHPTVFRHILYEWNIISDIHKLNIENIQKFIQSDPHFTNIIEYHLKPFSLFLSKGWKFNITKKDVENTENIGKHFFQENNYRHLIAQITGIQRVYIASSNQSSFLDKSTNTLSDTIENKHKYNKKYNITDFWNKDETSKQPFVNIQYIEIILREGNLLYIPYGCWYLQKVEEQGLILEAINNTYLALFA